MSSPPTRPIIASFDIGIKNMAYCVVEIDPVSVEATRILEWGIINMVPEVEKPPICCAKIAPPKRGTKKGCVDTASQCTSISSFTCAGANYCKKHIDKKRVISAKDFGSLKKKTIDALCEFCTSRSIVVDFSEKKAKIVENIENHLLSNFYIPITATAPKSAKEMDLICAGREMTRQLDAIFMGENAPPITHVFIENQISTIAVRMKTLQGMLTQYFILRGAETLNIKYISALKKLSSTATPGPKTKTTYSERKKQGIELCGKLLRESKYTEVSKWSNFFDNSRTKKDDLSDAFLQGVFGGGGGSAATSAAKDIKK